MPEERGRCLHCVCVCPKVMLHLSIIMLEGEVNLFLTLLILQLI